MRLFWLKRNERHDDGSSWVLPFGDLMSLLLAVFVMIAAMSELRAGGRFTTVGSAVREAFGFSSSGAAGVETPVSLADRLAVAGLHVPAMSGGQQIDERLQSACDVITDHQRVIIRVAGLSSFEPHSARLRPEGRMILERLAAFLGEGRLQLEVCGYSGDGPLPTDASFRDGLDLSYARARTAVDALVAAGVPRDCLSISARSERNPLRGEVAAGSREQRPGLDRRLEIVVHAVSTAMPAREIADREWTENG